MKYNNAVNAGAPSPAQNGGDVGHVAMLPVVNPFEHPICLREILR